MEPTDRPVEGDSDYDSNADEDFKPTGAEAADEDISSSSSEDESNTPKNPRKAPKKRKQAPVNADLDSGDEATIKESKRSKKRRKDTEHEEADADSGGEGGLIKTRAQRKQEKVERQEYKAASNEGVTVDVDALWATLSSVPIGRRIITAPIQESSATELGPAQSSHTNDEAMDLDKPPAEEAEMITIKRSYDFAGQTVTESKVVHRDSAEAKLYLASNTKETETGHNDVPAVTVSGTPLNRPLKRSSMFEPNPTGEVKGLPAHKQRLRTPSRADVVVMATREAEAHKARAQKLNTVQKSAIDWAAHVDSQGLKDELDEYGRSKAGYMAKMDFLRNVEGRREEEERKVRLMG